MARTKNLQDLEDTLSKEVFGGSLTEAHKKETCVQCKGPAGNFKDEPSRAEYEISGLCQERQDALFSKEV